MTHIMHVLADAIVVGWAVGQLILMLVVLVDRK